jgi:hypothetical protein
MTLSALGIFSAAGAGGVKATGGTITEANGFFIHTFTASGTFTPLVNITGVQYLVIAGGGGGGGGGSTNAGGGGGGAGG